MDHNNILQTFIDEDAHHNFLEFTSKDEILLSQQTSLANLMKHSLLVGAEKLLMARNSPRLITSSSFEPNQADEAKTTKTEKGEGKYKSPSTHNRKVRGRYKPNPIQSSRRNENATRIPDSVNSPFRFPLSTIALMAMLVLKLVSFQIRLFVRFLSLVFNFWLMLFMFPFRALTRIVACNASYLSLISFIYNRLKSPKSSLKMAIRLSRAFLCSFYVFSMLLGLLISAFAISRVIVKNLAKEPILRTENLNFDYTKTSPSALVPITGAPIPLNHKMQLTVSLTLPESDHNRELGIFQVRVESLSANGKVIFGSSYPTMLRFKSQPIRVAESLIKSVPLITGLQSDVQNLKVEIGEFAEGYEPTAWFKVILEQRAEKAAGSGVPQIYAASLGIASELPLLKRIAWNWRRTGFVWIGFSLFTGEVMIVLLICRPVILPGGRRSKTIVASGKKSKLRK